MHHAYVDLGYDAHRRVPKEAPGRLTPEGSPLLGVGVGNGTER
ncbi:hypothetical protein AB0G71_28990 [Streptomyces sp. NPDC020403]